MKKVTMKEPIRTVRTNRRTVVLTAWLLAAAAAVGGVTARAADVKPSGKPEETRMWMTVGERRFAVALADTAAAKAFAAMLPITLDMSDLNDNEKHVKLPKVLPADATRPGTIRNGDIMLYGSDTLVVFYLTFSSRYSYTRIGSVDDAGALKQSLGTGDVRVTFAKN